MAKASISRAWDEARIVIARDGGVLATIALALMVLPGMIGDLFLPHANPKAILATPNLIGFIIISLIGLVGQLAVVRIATGAGGTVGGAISHAARRMPAYIGACALWALPLAGLLFFIASNSDPENPPTGGTATLILVASLTVIVAIFVLVPRMLMSPAVASNENVGPLQIFQRSWNITRGNWPRLFGFFLLFVILMIVLMAVVGAVFGSIARLAFGELEPLSVGSLLVSIIAQAVGACLSVLFSVMAARIYLQLASPDHASTSVPSSRD